MKSNQLAANRPALPEPRTKGEQTRQKIVAAAAQIFNQRGYEGSSLADLMEATGLQKGGIYRHFSSKEELAAEAFDYTWQLAWNSRLGGVSENPPHLDRLRQLITNYVECRSPVPGGCPVLNTAVDADDGNPILRERVLKALRSWMNLLQSIVKDAVKAGETQPGVDPKSLATMVIASLEGALMISRIERSQEALKRIHQYLTDYIDTRVAAH